MLHRPSHTAYSFSTTIEDRSFFSARPVTASRIEILLIEEGSGLLITGKDRIPFSSGDIIMTGTHLCHQYKLDAPAETTGGRAKASSEKKKSEKASTGDASSGDLADRHRNTGSDNDRRIGKEIKVAVIRFLPDFWGDTFLNLTENAYIKVLLTKANLGIMPQGQTRSIVSGLMPRIMSASGAGKIIFLLEILHNIATSSELKFLTSQLELTGRDDLDRMEKIYQYSRSNFNRKIDLEEIAAVAYVSPNSFCRFFKSRAQKTYSRFLIELRVTHACNLLIESRLCAKRICMESGFNNFSNFHKCFKEITGKSPIEYQKEFKAVALLA